MPLLYNHHARQRHVMDEGFLWAVCNWIQNLDPIKNQIEKHLLQLYMRG